MTVKPTITLLVLSQMFETPPHGFCVIVKRLSVLLRGLGLTIAVVLTLAFIERPSSFSYTSDPRFRPPPWEPPCGLTEGIEIFCLVIFAIDLATKVTIRPCFCQCQGERDSRWATRNLHENPFCVFICNKNRHDSNWIYCS